MPEDDYPDGFLLLMIVMCAIPFAVGALVYYTLYYLGLWGFIPLYGLCYILYKNRG